MKPTLFHKTKHLKENQLMPINSACPFCGSERRTVVTLLQTNPDVSLLKCLDCHAASASQIPTKETLDEYYQSYYSFVPPNSDVERVTFEGTERIAYHIANRLNKYLIKRSIHVLDFGGGDGSISLSLANKLLKQGFNKIDITVVDYNETMVQPNNDRLSLTRYKTIDELPPQLYDFVIASAIIEHLPNAKETLTHLLNSLDNGGVFYARTPYVVPLIELANRIRFKWDFTFPAHIHDLGQYFWKEFISVIGLQLLESKPSIVEASLKKHFFRALIAYTIKTPWYLFGRRYSWVGGWEVFVQKSSQF